MKKRNALIIVDVQNDFCKNGSLEVPLGEEVIDPINKLICNKHYNLIVATQDWHPKNHKSFASNNNKKVGEIINLNGLNQIMWPDHCIQHTKGAAFHPDLDISKISHVVKKGKNPEIDSYSGFYDNDKKTQTELYDLLKTHKIEELEIVGLALDYCVKATAIDSINLGFKTTVLLDATRAVNLHPDDSQKTVQELISLGCKIKNSEE